MCSITDHRVSWRIQPELGVASVANAALEGGEMADVVSDLDNALPQS